MSTYREVFQPSNTLVGEGAINRIPHYIRRIHGKKAFVVSDEGLVKIGTVKKVLDVLEKDKLDYICFTEVKPNPATTIVEKALALAVSNECDYIVGIGGGSPLDVAKAVSILMINGGDIRDYEGVNISPKRGLPLIAVNTTAGTGSEVTKDYVITDEERKVKMLMVDYHCLPLLAVDDPQLMVEMPPSLTAATGMDALTHAIEAYVCKEHFPFSDGLALQAITLVSNALRRVVHNGTDMRARTDMCWAEYMAGLAFSNAGLGMVHAMAHQLGGFYNMPHGVANAVLLPYVMEYNASVCKNRYADVAVALGINTKGMTNDQASTAAIQYIRELSDDIKIPSLKRLGFQPKDSLTLATNAVNDTAMPGNPKDASVMDVKAVFLNAYEETLSSRRF